MRVLNLLWALPVAAFIQYYSFVAARLAWCGLRDCHGLGSALNEPMVFETLAALSIGAVLSAALLMLAPWTKRWRLRLIVPAVYSSVIATALLVWLAP
jgi:hypothetical protein